MNKEIKFFLQTKLIKNQPNKKQTTTTRNIKKGASNG